MTWLEWAVIALALDRLLMIMWAVYQGGRAAFCELRARRVVDSLPAVGGIDPGPYPFWRSTKVPESVEVASDGIVSLDYSSGPKRH